MYPTSKVDVMTTTQASRWTRGEACTFLGSSPTNHAVVAANATVESMNFTGFAQMATSRHVLSSRIISTAVGSASASIMTAKIVNTDCRDISSR